MRRALLLAGLLLMPDVLGLPDEPVVMAPNYLGVPEPVAFKAKAALPAGGPITGGTAPATVSGGGVAPAPVGMSAGGGGGPSSPQQRASEALRALGLSAEALDLASKTGEAVNRLGRGSGPNAPSGEFGDALTRSGITPEEFDTLLQSLPPGWTEGQDIPGLDELKFAPPPEIPDAGAGPAPVGGDPGGPGLGAGGAAGLAGTGLGLVSTLSGNRDVGRAGQGLSTAANVYGVGSSLSGAAGTAPTAGAAATTAGATAGEAAAAGAAEAAPSLAAGLSGAGFAFAPAALGFAGMNIATSVDEAARIKRDVASAKNVLGSKVPSAVSRLNKSLTDTQGVDFSTASTENLRAQMQTLQGAREELNAIDQAFKPGVMTVAGKPIHTGLTLDTVRPQMDALNLTQLRLQDELARRGVTDIPGAQSPVAWINAFAPDFFHQPGARLGYGASGEDAEMLSLAGADANPAAYANYARDPAYYGLDPNDPTLGFYRQLTGLQPGGYEQGLGAFLQGQGVQSPLRVASREPDPSAPMTEPSTGALEQLAAFGLLPGGGAARGEEVLETA